MSGKYDGMLAMQPGIGSEARPLSGLKIIEVAIWHAGPSGTAALADLGAEVIKIEALTGDQGRLTGKTGPLKTGARDTDSWTVLFDLSNRGKKGISVDLSTARGQDILRALLKTADVFVTNLRQETKVALGIDYPSISAINPGIIQVNVTGFGPKGEMAGRGAFDTLGQAMSGMMYNFGGEEPRPLSFIMLDRFTGITTSHAILTGLVARQLHGFGQEIDVSLLGSAMWLNQTNLVSSSTMQQNADTAWKRERNLPLRNTLKASDGKWIVGTNYPEPACFPRFCVAIGVPELVEDERFATIEGRLQNAAALNATIDAIMLQKTRDEWLEVLVDEHGLKFAPVLSFLEALNSDQVSANNYVQEVDHPVLGRVRLPNHPARFGRSAQPCVNAAPVSVGQHTAEVLRQHAFSPEDIQELSDLGVVKVA
ncbi:MAG: CoA transferase [Sphingomonadales bacterium]|nr:MAG: CoA transferase [Sphingomonadales bacterium]